MGLSSSEIVMAASPPQRTISPIKRIDTGRIASLWRPWFIIRHQEARWRLTWSGAGGGAMQNQLSQVYGLRSGPGLDQDVLRSSRSRQVCMTRQFFRHHPGPNSIPLLSCHLHQGLIADNEHLTHRCSGWTEDLHRHRGWAPEVA